MKPKITLGPVQYYWSKQALMDFYAVAAESQVDEIYLGETVCSKRRSLNIKEWLGLANELSKMGKKVILSTLTLIESESEISQLRSLIKQSDFTIEANDYAAVTIAQEFHKPFVAGCTLNAYNTQTLNVLAKAGMTRWHAPVEMSQQSLSDIMQVMKADPILKHIEVEIHGYGRLPLSHAARCFTARTANLPKDQCQTLCIQHPTGITMQSQDDDDLFQINGIQIQSHKPCNLIPCMPQVQSMDIDLFRVYGEDESIFELVKDIKQQNTLGTHIPVINSDACNGYWFGKPGLEFKYDM